MSKYLISTTETYRVDSEAEAQALIQENKKADCGELVKYSSTYKERKQKGEIVDAWFRVVLTKAFDSEKEPCNDISITYEEGANNEY